MDSLIKGEAVLAYFSETFSLLNARLDGVNICRGQIGIISIELTFCLTYPKDKAIKLLFTDVQEYYFSGGSDYYGYVTDYKLFSNDKGFYLSLAPDDMEAGISEHDGEMVCAPSVALLL